MHKKLLQWTLIGLCGWLSACAPSTNTQHPLDPYETTNRKIFAFNQRISRHFMQPIATVYTEMTPDVAQHAVSNFFDNLREPFYAANHALQGHWQKAGLSSWRFLINSTAGLAGLIDIASEAGLPSYPQTFSETLVHHGCKDTTYFVLPFFGPKVSCEVLALPVEYYVFDFWPYQHQQDPNATNGLLMGRLVSDQSRLLDAQRMVTDAFDPYVFMRHGYLSMHKLELAPPAIEDVMDDTD